MGTGRYASTPVRTFAHNHDPSIHLSFRHAFQAVPRNSLGIELTTLSLSLSKLIFSLIVYFNPVIGVKHMATVFKRVSSTMLAISLCVPLLACSTPSANSANNSSSTESTSEAPANTNSEGQVASISGGASITSGSSTSGTSVGIGDTINTSSIDFRILDAAFTDYIQSPSYSTGRYEYYTPDDGMVFVDVVAEITNKKDHPLNNPASVKAVYAEKYNYSANMMYEDENGGFDYPSLTSIDPLTTKVAHFMLSVPQEAQESTQPFTILITAKGSSERYVLALR